MVVQNILGYEIDTLAISNLNIEIQLTLEKDERKCAWLACFNPHSYAISKTDLIFETALRSANWLVADGVGVVIAGRILGRPIKERIAGADIFGAVMSDLNNRRGTVFFLGSTKKTLELIEQKIGLDYPNVTLTGTYSPPFKPTYSVDELDMMIDAVNQKKPDVLWVGMTAPKQEKWIAELQTRLDVKFAGAIGAVFDFYSGQVRRSHPLFQRLGLEWLPRLLRQPRRLWRRMFISAPVFLLDVIRQKYSDRTDP